MKRSQPTILATRDRGVLGYGGYLVCLVSLNTVHVLKTIQRNGRSDSELRGVVFGFRQQLLSKTLRIHNPATGRRRVSVTCGFLSPHIKYSENLVLTLRRTWCHVWGYLVRSPAHSSVESCHHRSRLYCAHSEGTSSSRPHICPRAR